MSFQVGDFVYVFRPAYTKKESLIGKIGCVKHLKAETDHSEYVGVEFTENIGGHDLEGRCKPDFGYWMRAKDMKKMEPLTTLLQKQWAKEWAPKLKRKEQTDSMVILEE